MGKKILIAVGDCTHSKTAVQYAAKVTAAGGDVRYTLFHVQPPIPKVLQSAAQSNTKVKAEIDRIAAQHNQAPMCTLEFKDLMVDEGISAEQIEVISEPMKAGMAKDILDRAERGQFSAIVIARRALTPSRDFFIGTTAAKVVEHALITPVWVVGEKTRSMDFLLAVDGSENSLRDVQHLIDMTGPNPDLKVTLFHVLPYLRHYYSLDVEKENPHLQELLHREDEYRMEDFYEQAHWRLKAAGLKQRQIKVKTNRRSHDISTAILQEAKSGGYGTVIVGRRGERDAHFTGRIALRMVQKVTDQNLWVIP